MSRIRVTIDRIVLKGVEPAARKAMIESLQAELSRALADPQTRAKWAHSHRTPVLRLGQLTLDQGAAGGRKLGSAMARSIGKGLKP